MHAPQIIAAVLVALLILAPLWRAAWAIRDEIERAQGLRWAGTPAATAAFPHLVSSGAGLVWLWLLMWGGFWS